MHALTNVPSSHADHVIVVVMYEYLITLGQELNLFWRGKITGAQVLFVINRYLNIAVVMWQFASTFVTYSDEVRVHYLIRCLKAILTISQGFVKP